MSKLEKDITRLLKILYPELETEVTLNKITGCIAHKGIRVDIWIKEISVILELMGIQHYKPQMFGGKNKIGSQIAFINQCNRDSKLKDICKQFNINYEQIDYNEKVDIAFLYRKFSKYLKVDEYEKRKN